jgi:DinB superfamily
VSFLTDAIHCLRTTPEKIEEAIRGLSEEQLSWKRGESFSIRENILHLRDIDVFGYEKRLRLLLTEDYPVLGDLDGAKLAIERNYNSLPIRPAIDDLKRSRTFSIHRLHGCSILDLDRKGEMQGTGSIDLRRLLELWMEHDRGHIADLEELRRALDGGSGPEYAKHQVA